MQASQRERYNPALETAVLLANALGLPVVVGLVLIDAYPGAQERHYGFMLEGWGSLQERLEARGMGVRMVSGEGVAEVVHLARSAVAVVTDAGYTRFQESWRQEVAEALDCPLLQVEADVVVPVETTSPKEEYAARTIRPRLHRHIETHLVPMTRVRLTNRSGGQFSFRAQGLHIPPTSLALQGGEGEARKHLKRFLRRGSSCYDQGRNDPGAEATSYLSPYLHFGQISAVDIALQAIRVWGRDAAEPLLEQLIVRRELAMNFVYYNDDYDAPACLPNWCVKALDLHADDPRPVVYAYDELEAGATHDPAWNAAQHQMVATGHMAGYMRMYWGKKVLEWSRDWREAYRTLVSLNDTYELDGRDPNGYAGVAWIFGKHDRPWTRRPIFGTIRYMNAAGLTRKFSVPRYIERWVPSHRA
jgi:deoxyribodipyrimidine photo-lyase